MPSRIFISGLLLCLALPARAADPPKRTLAELLELSRTRSPLVTAAQGQVEVRRAQKREVLFNWFPTGDVSFALTGAPRSECRVPRSGESLYNALTTDEARKDMRTRDCATTVDPLTDQPVNPSLTENRAPWFSGPAMGVSLHLTQPLFTFGKIEHGLHAASAGIEVEEQRVAMARAETELQVARAYWGLKAARTSLITAVDGRQDLSEWVDKIEEDLDRAKQRYTFTINDLQRLKLGLAQVDIIVADMERNIGIARRGLFAAIGEETDIDDEELDAVPLEERDRADYDREALLHRPDVKALDKAVEAFDELAKVALARALPDLGITLDFNWRYAPTVEDPQNAFLNRANLLGAGFYLGLRQPLDIAQKISGWQRARAEAAGLAAQRKAAIAGIGFEIAQAYENLGEARRRLEAADRGQRVARGWLNAVKQNLDIGTADARDLVDAARGYYELRLRYFQAIYDHNVAVATLRRMTGVDVAKPRRAQ